MTQKQPRHPKDNLPESMKVDAMMDEAIASAELAGAILRHSIESEVREIVICAAVKCSDGTIVRGHRHGNAMLMAHDMKKSLAQDDTQQGFITSKNRYVSREEGRILQDAAGIKSADKDGYRGKTLFSEDLY